MGVAKSDFSQVHRSRSDLTMNSQIDLDRSRFEKEWWMCGYVDLCVRVVVWSFCLVSHWTSTKSFIKVSSLSLYTVFQKNVHPFGFHHN